MVLHPILAVYFFHKSGPCHQKALCDDELRDLVVVHLAVTVLVSDHGHDSFVFCHVGLTEWHEEGGERYFEVHIEGTRVREVGLRPRSESSLDTLREGWRLKWIARHVELSDR